jgi:hypothetical protein
LFSVITEFGLCGFGRSDGLIPEVRVGVVRFAWCRGSLLSRVEKWHAALTARCSRDETSLSARPADSDGQPTGRKPL